MFKRGEKLYTGFFGEIIDRLFRRFARKTADKVSDKAADKVASVVADQINKNVDEQVATNGTNQVQAMADQAAIEAKTGEEKLGAAITRAAVANSAASKEDMAKANEMMNYFIFGKDMQIVGVKEDAPDWVKQAYANGEFNK